MAERVDALPEVAYSGGRTAIYPWDEWLDGSVWMLTQGDDFTSRPKNLQKYAQRVANERGLTVNTRVKGDVLYLQAEPRD